MIDLHGPRAVNDRAIEIFEAIRPEWMARGACNGLDADLFFPPRGGPDNEARRACGGCPVREECLDFALVGEERFGIWGGTSERERRKLRRRKAAA